MMENQQESKVEAIDTFILVLNTGFQLDVNNTFYIPSIARTSISVARLDSEGFEFKFGQDIF